MTTAVSSIKIVDSADVSVDDFRGFECSERVKRVDYKQIRTKAIAVFDNKAICQAWAFKFAFHGRNLKAGDYVQVKGTKLDDNWFKTKIADVGKNKGFVAGKGKGIGKASDKEVVSVNRLVRAFAADVTKMVELGCKIPAETEALAKKVNLDPKYAFVDSCYGMTDEVAREQGGAFIRYCSAFDDLIEIAYQNKWIEIAGETKKQSHKDNAMNYLKLRGFDIK